jgi:1-deoxy-D-xylulose-5-phosphate reductoisomerase
VPFLDLTRMGTLEFFEPAWDDFPCLELAYRALEADRSLPIVLNAANEVAVASFLKGRLRFTDIPRLISATMAAHTPTAVDTLADVRRVDLWARERASELGTGLESD